MNCNFLSFKSQQEQKENKEEPTRTEMFIETRKRKTGRTYKESDEDTLNKIVRTSTFTLCLESLYFDGIQCNWIELNPNITFGNL